MSTATQKKSTGASGTARQRQTSRAEKRVRAEIDSMLQINGNTPTAQDWVPRVVMMAYERRCAGDPGNADLADCFSVARSIASRS